MYLSGIWTLHKNNLPFYYNDALMFPIDFKAGIIIQLLYLYFV